MPKSCDYHTTLLLDLSVCQRSKYSFLKCFTLNVVQIFSNWLLVSKTALFARTNAKISIPIYPSIKDMYLQKTGK